MQIVVSHNFRDFVAGIFLEKESAVNFIRKIPESESSNVKQLEVDYCYPFYISEDHEGFTYLSSSEAVSLVGQFMKVMHDHDEEWCYTNLYKITEDFQAKKPGEDNMGLLPHYHIDNGALTEIKENGFENLWA